MTITNIAPTSSAATSTSSTSSTGSSVNSLANESTFLKLFTAQLKFQDPLNPNAQDGAQMVSQLAQFSELEQVLNIGTDVHSIASKAAASTAVPAPATPATNTKQ